MTDDEQHRREVEEIRQDINPMASVPSPTVEYVAPPVTQQDVDKILRPSFVPTGSTGIGMIDTDELIAFLRDRKADEERVALAASAYGDTWRASDPGIYPSDESRHPGPIIGGVWGDLEDEYAEHIALWGPGNVLAKLRADRQILDLVERWPGHDLAEGVQDGRDWNERERDRMVRAVLIGVVQELAQPYAAHPAFRDEWRVAVDT